LLELTLGRSKGSVKENIIDLIRTGMTNRICLIIILTKTEKISNTIIPGVYLESKVMISMNGLLMFVSLIEKYIETNANTIKDTKK